MTTNLIAAFLIYGAAIPVLTFGGNTACRAVLKLSGAKIIHPQRKEKEIGVETEASTVVSKSSMNRNEEETLRAGRIIGSLERVLISIGLIAQSWEVMVAVIALKTVARFRELDERIEAEYFLIGSLVSILWAVLVTMVVMTLDGAIGMNLSGLIRGLVGG
jgi:hypothetical protein